MAHVLVTAAGTSEPIDDVRVVTNRSTGRFGAALCHALVSAGHRVTLLAGANLARQPTWVPPQVRIVPFETTDELKAGIERIVKADPVQWLFMAAAVSDYAPVITKGKIRSTESSLVVKMQRTPKILPTLRHLCGPDTFICGFKLLSGVSSKKLIDTARAQVLSGGLNLCFANDFQQLTKGQHPAWLVDEHHATAVSGTKAQSAEALVHHVEALTQTTNKELFPTAQDEDWKCLFGLSYTTVPAFAGWPTVNAAQFERAYTALTTRAIAGGPPGFSWSDGDLLRVAITAPGEARAWLTKAKERWRGEVYPAFDGGVCVGVVGEHEGVRRIWIAPHHRNRGLGTSFAFACAYENRGFGAVGPRAQALFQLGFTEDSGVWRLTGTAHEVEVCLLDVQGKQVLLSATHGSRLQANTGQTKLEIAQQFMSRQLPNIPPHPMGRSVGFERHNHQVVEVNTFVFPVFSVPENLKNRAWRPLSGPSPTTPVSSHLQRQISNAVNKITTNTWGLHL